MCNCYDEVVKKYREETGDPHAGVYGCYSFSLGEVPEIKAHHRFRRKDGVLTDRTVTECILPTFCPFCGRKYEKE